MELQRSHYNPWEGAVNLTADKNVEATKPREMVTPGMTGAMVQLRGRSMC